MAKRRSSKRPSRFENKQEMRARRRKTRQSKVRLWVGLAVVGFLAAGAFIFRPRPSALEVPEARLADDPVVGGTNALVTIEEFGDFGCPSCRVWHQAGIQERILAKYGDRVKFVWRDFPVITSQSPKAAEAAQCAYDQGEFWEYHDLLFERSPALSVSALKAYAVELGFDENAFTACLDSGQHKATVERDLREAINLGFRGTPSFVVNGQRLVGPPSYDTLQSIIEASIQ